MKNYKWFGLGDVNAFFGLTLDNVAVLLILVTTITSSVPWLEQKPGNRSFSPDFVISHMVPGTAIGVLLGDLVYTWMAFRLARKTGNQEVTAMPLGLDTPSTFGMAFLVLLPALQQASNPENPLTLGEAEPSMRFAWHVGLMVLLMIGVVKLVLAPLGNQVRRLVPRAGLLGSLAAIALALIAFLPLVNDGIASVPLIGMLVLSIVLFSLVAHQRLPFGIPGALAALGWLSIHSPGPSWFLPLVCHRSTAWSCLCFGPLEPRTAHGGDKFGQRLWGACLWPCLSPWPQLWAESIAQRVPRPLVMNMTLRMCFGPRPLPAFWPGR